MSPKHRTVIFVIFCCISIIVTSIAIWHERTAGKGKTSDIGTCEDIAAAKGIGSAVFERKIPGARVQRLVPFIKQHTDIYTFEVFYIDKYGITRKGAMGVEKATCRTVVSPDF